MHPYASKRVRDKKGQEGRGIGEKGEGKEGIERQRESVGLDWQTENTRRYGPTTVFTEY